MNLNKEPSLLILLHFPLPSEVHNPRSAMRKCITHSVLDSSSQRVYQLKTHAQLLATSATFCWQVRCRRIAYACRFLMLLQQQRCITQDDLKGLPAILCFCKSKPLDETAVVLDI